MFRFLCLFSTKYISLMISQEALGIQQAPGQLSGGACRVSKKLLPPPFMEAPQGGLSCPLGAIHLQLSKIGSSEPIFD